MVDHVHAAGGRAFVTDTNVLYRAARHDAIGNLRAAAANGFTAEIVGAPIVVADGLTGRDGVDDNVEGGVRLQTARRPNYAMIACQAAARSSTGTSFVTLGSWLASPDV